MMTRFALILALIAIVLVASTSAWPTDFNSAKTTGLSSAWMTSSGQDATRAVSNGQWYYNFSLRNNTSNVSPLLDANGVPFAVLIDTLEFNKQNAVDGATIASWSWQGNKFVKTLVQTGSPYIVPPSLGPGEAQTGFTLYFTSAQTGFEYLTHVYAVVPQNPLPPTSPITYDLESVTLSASKSYVLQPGGPVTTWWDLSGDKNPQEAPVPEASSLLLGSMGLFGPAGYLLARRRKS